MTRRNWYLSAIAIVVVIGAIAIGGVVADFMKTLARAHIRTKNITGVAKVIRSGEEVYGVFELHSRSGEITYGKAPLGNFKSDSEVSVQFDKETRELKFTYGDRQSTSEIVE